MIKSLIKKKYSLSRDYLIIISLVTIFILIVSTLYSLISYSSYSRNQERQMLKTALIISNSVENSFNYVEHLMTYFANQISEMKVRDDKNIARLLTGDLTNDPLIKQLFSWTMFDWIDQKNYIVSNSTLSDNFEPINMRDRSYINSLRKYPMTLQFSHPAIGKPSGEWVIPVAYGVLDTNQKYIGAIGIGFNIAELQKKIIRDLGDSNFYFAILDDKLNLVIHSGTDRSKPYFKNELQIFYQDISPENQNFFFANTIKIGEESYAYYQRIPGRPFFILVGYNNQNRLREVIELIIKSLSVPLTMGLVLVCILLIFRKILISPVIFLSKLADRIIDTDGRVKVIIPSFKIVELDILGKRIANLFEYIVKLRATQSKLSKSKLLIEKTNTEITKINLGLEQKVIMRTAELEKALSAKTEFLNNISHEVRTPIQGFNAITKGLIEHWSEIGDKERFSYIKQISKNSSRLINLVSNLLDLSKSSEGKMLLDLQYVDLNKIILSIIDECQTLYMEDKFIKIRFFPKNKSAKTFADKERIAQVLRNLLTNAIKFSKKNKTIDIYLELSSLLYDKQIDAKGWLISVKDQGVGLPKEELESIFFPFVQSSITKTKAGGTGLGLSIAKEIVDLHRGKIWAENNIDKGSTFHFIIPKLNYSLSKESSTGLNNKKNNDASYILIIDDEDSCFSSISLILFGKGFNLIYAQSGIEGLNYLTSKQKIDLILLDLMMPDINGINVLQQIKNIPERRDIPVILQSGTSDEHEIKKAFELGIFDFIRKPFEKKALLDKIAKALKYRPTSSLNQTKEN
jgi:two-component system sensor histidine kinase ChiS